MQRLSSIASFKLCLALLTLGCFSLPVSADEGTAASGVDRSSSPPDSTDPAWPDLLLLRLESAESEANGAESAQAESAQALERLGWSPEKPASPGQSPGSADSLFSQAESDLALPLDPNGRDFNQIELDVQGDAPPSGSQFRTAPDGSMILDLRRQSETYRQQQSAPEPSPGTASPREVTAPGETPDLREASPALPPLPGLSDPVLNPVVSFSEDSSPLFNPADLAEGPEEANPLSPPLPRLPGEDDKDYQQLVPTPLLEGALFDPDNPFQLVVQPLGDDFVPADGRSRLPIVGQIFDLDGNPIDQDAVVTLTTNAGEFLGADYDDDRLGFQVLARRGQFQVPLRSSLSAQQVLVRAAFDPRQLLPEGEQDVALTLYPEVEAYTEVEFTTYLRPSLVSGVVDLRLGPGAANFWGSFADYLRPEDIGDVDFDVDAAIFATGAIGEWLFTGAFNSDRALNERCDGTGLYRDVQACDQTYPVYGDSSTTDFLTPSIDSFYARLQRDSDQPGAEADYVMWGDYNTFEFSRASQEFTATSRQLHGFKGNYSIGPVQLTAMYANNLKPFQRDTITPDGTSGIYFLSQRLLVPGSEDIYIELEELNRPGTVIERVRLTRNADYEIDYDRGSLLFRQPIQAVEVNPLGVTLVRRIVATYQVDDPDAGGDLFAGRLQYNFTTGPEQDSWVGATFLTQDEGAQDFTLVGADAYIPLGDRGLVVGEFAHSSFTSPGINQQGEAFRIEADGELFDNVLGRIYLRSAEEGFRNSATTSFRPGQTRWGAGINAGLGPDTRLRLQYDQESNYGVSPAVLTSANALLAPGQESVPGPRVDNTLRTINLGVEQRLGEAVLGFDWVNRSRSDRVRSTDTSAHQLVPRFAVPLGMNLTFQAQTEINLTSDVDPLYPSRTTFGLDWAAEPGVTVRLAQQFISGGGTSLQPGSITSLDTIFDYALTDNTSLTSRYSILTGYNGLTGQGAIGLNHRIKLAPGLHANLGFERIFGDVFNDTGAGQQFAQPYAVGTGASALGLQSGTAYSVGLEYTDNPDFQASARFEHRSSPSGSNNLFGASAAGKINPALTALFRYQHANYANQLITGQLGDTINLRLGMAYRNPVSDQFNGLLSYEFRQNPATTPDTILQGFSNSTSDHTLAMEGIYAPNWQWEFYGKYALRYNQGNVAEDVGFSNTLHLAQLRASYQFAYRWDVLAETRWIGQPATSFSEVGFALELGYYLTPDLRLGAGYSFGSANDGSFAGSGYRSASGPYIGVSLKVNELFNGFGRQEVVPPQQEDSLVDTVAEDSPPQPDTPAQPESTPLSFNSEDWVSEDWVSEGWSSEGWLQDASIPGGGES
jgi:hypothetical protein